ncbi:transcriptional modulator of MazE/toxin, MazF [Desulfonatronospira thiodismutans ASO3-1]|uniref:Transcriptional modulator of MazE/toxin, MazF n=1 Tax=Desulfonatronospira thiodismutans ASO3-1 TaxID=555779 RepID=D6SL99_9BACT|nr:transcriptional modulator of MazE/toxin, MazF [Desulfonatronospira thiodismutans ASO3-1]
MGRGDILPVVQPGTYGKPRPALVIQSDFFGVHPSVTILPITSKLRDAPLFRLRVDPTVQNGLLSVSEVMVDKITTLPSDKLREPFGHLEYEYMREVERLLTVWMGIG